MPLYLLKSICFYSWQLSLLCYLLVFTNDCNASPAPLHSWVDDAPNLSDHTPTQLKTSALAPLQPYNAAAFAESFNDQSRLIRRVSVTHPLNNVFLGGLDTQLKNSNATYKVTIGNLRILLPKGKTIELLENIFDYIAFALQDLDALDAFEDDLILEIGMFKLEFHALADHLSLLAVKVVIKRLAELAYEGFIGFMNGTVSVEGFELNDDNGMGVKAAVGVAFAFGVW